MSEEGCYLPCRIAKVSHSSRILYTCIWKVPLDYFDFEEPIGEGDSTNCDPHTVVMKRKIQTEWTKEQIEIIESFEELDERWKFQFDSFVEYNMNQNQLHDKCQKLARLGYRVDQIVGIQHSFQIKTATTKVEPNIIAKTNGHHISHSP